MVCQAKIKNFDFVMFLSQIKLYILVYILHTVFCDIIYHFDEEFRYKDHYIQKMINTDYVNISPKVKGSPKSILYKSKLPDGLFFSDGKIYGTIKEIVKNYTVTVEAKFVDKIFTEILTFWCIILLFLYLSSSLYRYK